MKNKKITIEYLEDRLSYISTQLGAGNYLFEENTVREVCAAYHLVLEDLRLKKSND